VSAASSARMFCLCVFFLFSPKKRLFFFVCVCLCSLLFFDDVTSLNTFNLSW
jgi:hypothetical protein